MEPRRTRLTDADHALWASYADGVRPLAGRDRPPAAAATPQPSPARPALPRAAFARRTGCPTLAIGVQPGGVDSATWHRFRTGRLPTTRVLDLHGHTAQRAFHALAHFLHAAHAEKLRCVEVVTGQGSVLRRELPQWLNLPDNRPLVLAAVHPHPANPGSVRLLLRRGQ